VHTNEVLPVCLLVCTDGVAPVYLLVNTDRVASVYLRVYTDGVVPICLLSVYKGRAACIQYLLVYIQLGGRLSVCST
jgi:hypothetical protein